MRIIDDITEFIFIHNEVHRADIIFIPGCSHPELGEQSAELWKQGYAPLVLPSGKFSIKAGKFPGPKSKAEIYNGDYQTESAFLTDVLVKNGVAPDAIIGEDKSEYTKQNAMNSKGILDENNLTVSKAILVCKSFHARRAFMYYQLAFPNVEFFVCPVDCMGISRDNWYQSDLGIQKVLGELMRCGDQFADEISQLKKSLS